MNPTAIYSKSGKGVQEAAGKTSLLERPDRAVLSAIDGRATLADVAQKVGKPFDAAFQGLIVKLDKDGFIRQVSAGTAAAAAPAPKPAPKPAAKKPAPADPGSDLDFSMLGASKPASVQPSRPAAPPKPAAPPPPPPKPAAPPPKEQESALFKARQEAEAKAAAERERLRAEGEAKMRAETEAKLRAEAEAKLRAEAEARAAAEAEAKVKAAREAAARAAAEVKAKADGEAKRAREEAERARRDAEERERRAKEEAERVRREAEEKAERIRREAEEKGRREAEELRQRLEEERKAREEAERRMREEAERARRLAEEEARKAREEVERQLREEAERERKALEEERRKLEEERRRRDEDERREEEERAARRRRDEEEEEARRRKREEEDSREAAEREARRRARAEEEAREAEAREARRRAREEEEAREAATRRSREDKPAREDKRAPEAPRPAAPAPTGDVFADSLMADLASFTSREEEEAKAKAEAERKADEEKAARRREEEARRAAEEEKRAKEEAKRKAKEEKERLKREEEERLAKEEAEEKERIRVEEERRKREAEERERKAKLEESLARRAQSAAAADYAEDSRRDKARAAQWRRPGDERGRRQRGGWGKPVAITLFLVLVVALGAAHIMPIATVDYERAASEALGRPVRLAQARLWLLSGLPQLRFQDVSVGDIKIARVIAHPAITSLTDEKKHFDAIELEGVSLPQATFGNALFARVKSERFSLDRAVARKLELPGQVPLPKDLEAELVFNADGAVRLATLRGPEGLVAKLEPKGAGVDFQVEAGAFTLPIAPQITLNQFAMKGSADAQGLQIKEWDGSALNGSLSGTARVRWGGTWVVDGVLTARGINAAVFAPALLSEGRAEGTGKFTLAGTEPAKLAAGGRLEGNFTISKGVLGSFDLSRAIQTSGRAAQGRTQFAEMNGHGVYESGTVSLRNVTIGAGALNAGASADIAENGALSGRIVADVRVASQTLRATLSLGGTVREPQVRN